MLYNDYYDCETILDALLQTLGEKRWELATKLANVGTPPIRAVGEESEKFTGIITAFTSSSRPDCQPRHTSVCPRPLVIRLLADGS